LKNFFALFSLLAAVTLFIACGEKSESAAPAKEVTVEVNAIAEEAVDASIEEAPIAEESESEETAE
jgi:predicted component of type VI protein secretion system